MSDDLLSRAARALRERDDEAAPPPVLETRHRIVATLRQKRSSRVVWLRRVLPIAAILVTSSAWAAANGHLGGTMREVAAFVGLADDTEPEAPRPAPSQLAADAPAPRANDVAPVTVPSEPSPTPEEVSTPHDIQAPAPPPTRKDPTREGVAEPVVSSSASATASARAPAKTASSAAAMHPGAVVTPRASASADDPAQPLYAAAHQRHFAERDYAGALAAWESYLRAAPGGRFAAEAQYNRAICLVRLGRNVEAKPALRAFADGGYGGYRQTEAKALLDALDGP